MATNSYNLQNFYSSLLKRHPIRLGHQFYIEFIGPEATSFGLDGSDEGTKFKYYAKSSKIPAVDITSAKVPFYGAGFEVPGVVKYPDSWNVKILLESGMSSGSRNEQIFSIKELARKYIFL